jgi:hypothetical protein
MSAASAEQADEERSPETEAARKERSFVLRYIRRPHPTHVAAPAHRTPTRYPRMSGDQAPSSMRQWITDRHLVQWIVACVPSLAYRKCGRC